MSGSQSQSDRVPAQWAAAITAMLGSPTLDQAAQKIGKSVSTLRRWRKLPAFESAYRDAKSELLELTTNRLRQAMIRAVETLEGAMIDAQAPWTVRVNAASKVLELGLRAQQSEASQERSTWFDEQVEEILETGK